MRAKRPGTCWMIGGLLLIAAALCLAVYNGWESDRAAEAVSQVMQELRPQTEPTDLPTEPALSVTRPEPVIPDYLRDPHIPMPTREIDGEAYIGVLDIPALGLSLPVISEWSDARLKIAPCRYQGSAYLDDLIIMAHNYASYFGPLLQVKIGDRVYFTDAEGNVFAYDVVEVETLDKNDAEGMVRGEWDLTLFTCTVGGQYRVTARCDRAEAHREETK